MAQSESLELTVEESSAGLEAGEDATGVIKSTEVRTFEFDGDDVTYYQINIEEDETGIELSPDYPAGRLTEGTMLGRLVSRFGVDLEIGKEIDLADVFEPGTAVAFEVGEEEGDDATFLSVEEETLRPKGAKPPSMRSEEDDEEPDEDEGPSVGEEVLEYVGEHEGDSEREAKQALAKEGGEYLQEFKRLVNDGDILVTDDGEVFLG